MRTFNLADLFEIVCETVPDRPMLAFADQHITYAAVNRRADAVAGFLQARGVTRGDNVGLQLSNCPAYMEVFFACCKIGATPFNINYRYTGKELEYLYNNADAKALFFGAEMSEVVVPIAANIESLEIVVQVGSHDVAADTDKPFDYEQILAEEPSGDAHAPRQDDDLLMIYTGGTTGMPKGVIWPHKNLFFGALGGGGWYHPEGAISEPAQLASRVIEGPQLTTFPVAPLMHGAAFWTAMSSVFAGHTIVLNEQANLDAAHIWDLTEREGVSIMAIVGDAVAIPLVEALEAEPSRWTLSNFHHMGSGGAVFSKDVQRRLKACLPHVVTASSLGATETGVMGPGTRATDEGIMRYDARPDITVVVDQRTARTGELGEIARRGYLPTGYYGDAEKSARTFMDIDGMAHALGGDTARIEEDGSITVLGRGSTCINSGGEKVFPEEVEQALKSHPAVFDALVVGIPHPRWIEMVVAVISFREHKSVDVESLREHCRAQLAAYKVPKQIEVESELRRSVVGKPDYVWAKSVFENDA